eukprot:Nk52_evm27s226 gene=Nk52_evmTU27s226
MQANIHMFIAKQAESILEIVWQKRYGLMMKAEEQLLGISVSPDFMVLLKFDVQKLTQESSNVPSNDFLALQLMCNELKLEKTQGKYIHMIACCEFKHRCSAVTVQKAHDILDTVLKQKFRVLKYSDNAISKTLSVDDRYQVLHQALAANVNFVLYGVSDKGGDFVFVILIYFDNYIIQCLREGLLRFRQDYFSWLYKTKNTPTSKHVTFDKKLSNMPIMDYVKFKTAGDRETVKVGLQIMMHLMDIIKKNNYEPFPDAKCILPYCNVWYDCTMNNSDLFSQASESHKARYSHVSPDFVLLDQCINLVAYNCHQLFTMRNVERRLLDKKNISTRNNS